MLRSQTSGPKFNPSEEVGKLLSHSTPFRVDALDIRVGAEQTIVYVPEQAVVKFNGELVNILSGIHRDGEYLITNQWLYGHMVSVRTRAADVQLLGAMLSDSITRYGQKKVVGILKERFRDQENDPALTEKLILCLREIGNGES